MTFLFWAALILVLYTYLGYGLVLYILVLLKRVIQAKPLPPSGTFEPEITLLVAAYNEKDYIAQKVNNTRHLDYPPHKLKQVWIPDGSN
ncbi:MAG: glycosyltransferase family 2 protein, partial [Saprospiraceae bacterium]|nr:glycosyltransferase family 2 protein [Saprospiraceae bacterium]